MYSVTKIVSFCYGHRLLNYEGKCKYLHGHNGRAEILLEAENLDHRGMVIDFTDIKNIIKNFINEQLDHKILLCREDKLAPVLKQMNEPHFLLDVNPTAENIAKLICGRLLKNFKSETAKIVKVTVCETPEACASYYA